MTLGREVHQLIALMFETQANKSKCEEPHAYVQNLEERIHRVHTLVSETAGETPKYRKCYYGLTKKLRLL